MVVPGVDRPGVCDRGRDPVKTVDIQKAKLAARLFIQRADAVLAERAEREAQGYSITGTKASGSLNRVSIELTRVLASMRNPK